MISTTYLTMVVATTLSLVSGSLVIPPPAYLNSAPLAVPPFVNRVDLVTRALKTPLVPAPVPVVPGAPGPLLPPVSPIYPPRFLPSPLAPVSPLLPPRVYPSPFLPPVLPPRVYPSPFLPSPFLPPVFGGAPFGSPFTIPSYPPFYYRR